MAKPTFYCRKLDEDHETVTLSPSESSHAIKAKRLRVGASISQINGCGLSADAEVIATAKGQLSARISHFEQHSRPDRNIVIAVAIPKGNRQRVMVEMLTQFGVMEIIPLQCEFSVTSCNTNTPERWSRYAVEACKQSHNPWLPQIRDGCSLESLIMHSEDQGSVLLYADRDGKGVEQYRDCGSFITACIGPEGGFSPNEMAMFNRAGADPVRFGDYILRTETAALAAAMWLVME